MKRIALAVFATACALASLPASASTVHYNFNWTGSDGYSMTGNFSYDSSSAGDDDAIRNHEVTSLFYEGFLNGVSIGSTANAHLQDGFIFNFDAVAGQFFLYPDWASNNLQAWNPEGPGLGFVSNYGASVLSLDGMWTGFAPSASLTATLVPNAPGAPAAGVPEPASYALVGVALFGAAAATRRRRAV